MAIWKTYRVADAVTEIDEEKFVLPVIQRSLIWSENQMELLFDTLLKGDSFQIELTSNPTTGYSWKWVNRKSVSIVDTIGYKYLPDSLGLVGSGGKEIWLFKGIKIGVDSLCFEYNRVWEANSTVNTKTIYVRIK